MKTANIDEIMTSMRSSYGSLSEPDFSFIELDKLISPLLELRNWLDDAKVTEDTDLDTDVCFSFLIESNKAERFLQLSLVGPFACIRILGKVDRYLSLSDELDPVDVRIIEFLQYKDFALVEPSILSRPVPELVLFNTDKRIVSIYHGLFSDSGRAVLE